jgi:hypothetical protein
MPHVLAGGEVDEVAGDVLGVSADPFQGPQCKGYLDGVARCDTDMWFK